IPKEIQTIEKAPAKATSDPFSDLLTNALTTLSRNVRLPALGQPIETSRRQMQPPHTKIGDEPSPDAQELDKQLSEKPLAQCNVEDLKGLTEGQLAELLFKASIYATMERHVDCIDGDNKTNYDLIVDKPSADSFIN